MKPTDNDCWRMWSALRHIAAMELPSETRERFRKTSPMANASEEIDEQLDLAINIATCAVVGIDEPKRS